jgi:hypothetical protein
MAIVCRNPQGIFEFLEHVYHKLLVIDEGVKTGQVTLDLALDTLVVELTQ